MNNTGIKPRVLNEIYDIAKENNVEKLFLFGSRARGDYKPTSDIDLAFIGGNSSNFILSVDEDTYTLLKFDIIDLSKPVDQKIKESIENEGILIYEKSW